MVGYIIDLTDRASDLDRHEDFLDSINGDHDLDFVGNFEDLFLAVGDFVFFRAVGEMFSLRAFFRSWRSFLLLVVLFLSLLSFAFSVPGCLVFCLGFSCCLVIDLLVEDYLFIGK